MNSPIVYLEVESEDGSADYYIDGVNVIENPDEFKARVSNTGRPPSSFKIYDFASEDILVVEVTCCTSKNELIPSQLYHLGFLTSEDLLRFIDYALPDRIEPTISRKPTSRVLGLCASLSKRWPSITPLIAYTARLGDRWDLERE
jgi:hypothetical protein